MKTSTIALLLILFAAVIGHHVYTNHKAEVKHDAEGNLYERWPESSHWTPTVGVERDGDWNIAQHVIGSAKYSNGEDLYLLPGSPAGSDSDHWFMTSPTSPFWMGH
jgi:hypothetical protein